VGSNTNRGMDVSVRFFCVCVVLCIGGGGSGLATGWGPVQGVLPSVYRIKNLKRRGCIAIDRYIDREFYDRIISNCSSGPCTLQLEDFVKHVDTRHARTAETDPYLLTPVSEVPLPWGQFECHCTV
jgi:hypothetical protein